jgi:hypothetical protein
MTRGAQVVDPLGNPGARRGRRRTSLAGVVEYLRVDPNIVIEVDVDAALEWGRYRHPARYRRPDLRLEDLVSTSGSARRDRAAERAATAPHSRPTPVPDRRQRRPVRRVPG